MIAGTVSAVVVILLIILAVWTTRRRAKHVDGENAREDDGSTRSLSVQRANSSPISGIHPATDTGNIETSSQYLEASSHGTLGQSAMSVGESENYFPLSYPASTLPDYVEIQRSVSPPAYSDLSARQSQNSVSRNASFKRG